MIVLKEEPCLLHAMTTDDCLQEEPRLLYAMTTGNCLEEEPRFLYAMTIGDCLDSNEQRRANIINVNIHARPRSKWKEILPFVKAKEQI